jgi:hypothetical protein
MLPATQKSLSLCLGMKIGARSRIRGRWTHTHTHTEGRQQVGSRVGLLELGPTPPRLNEDAPTITAMAVGVIAKAAETCGIPEGWVSSIDAGRMLVPFFVVRS